MNDGDCLPLAVVLTGGLVEPEWRRFAEALAPLWPLEVALRPALPPSTWDGILLTEGAALLPALRSLKPEAAELLAARAVVRAGSRAAAERLLAERLVLGVIPGDAWFDWLFPDQGDGGSVIYGFRDFGADLGLAGQPITGQPDYAAFRAPDRDLPRLVAAYLAAALGIEAPTPSG